METKRNLPRDLFLHLLAMVALYWSAVSLVTVCWQYVNRFFPDVLSPSYGAGFSGPMRFAVASLIIVFPVFLLSSWFLNRIYRHEAAVRESKIRKWLIYLTLFVAALVIIGDLVGLINTFLGGEITARFALKALSVMLVAAVVFGYYLEDVRRPEGNPWAKWFAWGSALVVLVAVVAAFFAVGSPAKARQLQLDMQRVEDLQGIQQQVVGYWQSKQQLPQSLADLTDSISGYAAPTDPVTGQPYSYQVQDAQNLQFELCADFTLPSQPGQPTMYPALPGSVSQTWDHLAGHYCFTRQIDKQLYPPKQTQ